MNVKINKHQDFKILLEKMHPTKVKEHVFLTIQIKKITRAMLQELVRHQHLVGLSVKSTRYTLNELIKEKQFNEFSINDIERASKYIRFTGDTITDMQSMRMLDMLRLNISSTGGKNRDIVKYNIPECYYTDLIWTVNLTNLKNFISLRSSKSALLEIREFSALLKEELDPELLNFIGV